MGFQLPLSLSKVFWPAFVSVLVPRSCAEGRGHAGKEGEGFASLLFLGREAHSAFLAPAHGGNT